MSGDAKSFLRPWCEILGRHLRVDTTSDAHMTNAHSSCQSFYIQLDGAGEDDTALLRLREALLLTSIYKRLDPLSWVAEMTRVVPECEDCWDLDRDNDAFDVTIKLGELSSVWSSRLSRFFDTTTLDEGNEVYKSDLERLVQRGRSRKAKVDDILSPVRVHLDFCPSTKIRNEQNEALTFLSDSVGAIRNEKRSDAASVPSLNVASVSLHLRRFALSSHVLMLIETILNTGVGIPTLSLPGSIDEDDDESEVAVEAAWNALVQVMLLSSTDALPKIERIELPHAFMIDALSSPFFCALASATNVRSVRIQYSITTAISQLHTAQSFWTQFCQAVVCPPPGNALEVLELDGFTSIPSVALSILRQLISDDRTTRSSRLQRLVIHDDALVPWPLSTYGRYEVWQWLPQLLDLIGHSLTMLGIDCMPVDEHLVASCISRCPRLTSLRVTRAYFSSMEPLVEAYESKTCLISSLDLRSLTTPSSVIEDFLTCLTTENSGIREILQNLHLGDSPDFAFNDSIRHHFVSLLKHNKHLHTLRITKCAGIFLGDKQDAWSELRRLNGEMMPGPHTPLGTSAKLSFLSSIIHIGTTPTMPFLDHDCLQAVIQFAAIPTLRRVYVDFDTKMASFFLG